MFAYVVNTLFSVGSKYNCKGERADKDMQRRELVYLSLV